MKLTWAYPVVIQHFYSYQLLLFDWHAPKIASCPPDDQQTTFYLYAAHIQHTYSQHPALPPHRFTLNSSWSCVIVSLPDTNGTFSLQKPSRRDRTHLDGERDSLGWGRAGGGGGSATRSWGGRQEPPRADWLKSPKFSATTTDHNYWRPLEVWGQVCLFCLLAK